jgi:NADPH:quinone reductase-like Zn-dependent oxidoreductase
MITRDAAIFDSFRDFFSFNLFFFESTGKSAWYARRAGTISGCDFSGIVEEIGSNVPHGLRSIGERVAGLVQGGQSIYTRGGSTTARVSINK